MKKSLQHMLSGHSARPEDVSQLMQALMAGEADPIAAAAFLVLQARNGIDGDQLHAALEVMLNFAHRIDIKDPKAIDNCGTGGDGGGSFNVSTTAAFVIAGAGHTVAKHGNRAVSSSCGSADLLEHLGINLALNPEQVKTCIDDVGIGFMFAPVFHPAVRHAVPIRKAIKVRTMFNMLGPLANPAGVNHQLIGVFQPELTETFAQSLAQSGKTAFVVHGGDGSDEVSLSHPTRVSEVRDGRYKTYQFDPAKYGFQPSASEAMNGGTLESNTDVFKAVLQQKQAGPEQDLVVLNAGFAMMTSGNYQDFDQAFTAARQAIETGAAWQKVEALIAWTQSQA